MLLQTFAFHWDSGKARFSQMEIYSCKHLTIFYINYRLHLQTAPGDTTTKTFKTTFSQTDACTSLGFILKEAQRSTAQKILCINHCKREDTSITDPCAECKMSVKERQKSSGAGLTSPSPIQSPISDTVVTQSGHCDYMVWKALMSTSTFLCNLWLCRFGKVSLKRFLQE